MTQTERTVRVTLKRGPLGSRTWDHLTFRAAWTRAMALRDLHYATVTMTPKRDYILVDASAFYTDAAPKAR